MHKIQLLLQIGDLIEAYNKDADVDPHDTLQCLKFAAGKNIIASYLYKIARELVITTQLNL